MAGGVTSLRQRFNRIALRNHSVLGHAIGGRPTAAREGRREGGIKRRPIDPGLSASEMQSEIALLLPQGCFVADYLAPCRQYSSAGNLQASARH
jgi:hypothetical protein